MKTVYDASNSVEAYMILNLLECDGIKGRVDGEFLTGGVGELQAIGIVQVAVEDEDYEAAKAVIQKWESEQPAAKTEAGDPKFYRILSAFFMGVAFGMGIMVLVYSIPVI